jgi:hypothetical protein
VTGRRGRRRRKLLDDFKERRGYCHLKEEALDRTMWRAGFGRGFGPVVRETAKWMLCLIFLKLPSYSHSEINIAYFLCVLEQIAGFSVIDIKKFLLVTTRCLLA